MRNNNLAGDMIENIEERATILNYPFNHLYVIPSPCGMMKYGCQLRPNLILLLITSEQKALWK